MPRLHATLTCLMCLTFGPGTAHAQLEEGIKSWAAATSGLTTAVWGGPRVPFPTPSPRPAAAYRLESALRPLAVHAAEGVPVASAERALQALEFAHDVLTEAGWSGDDLDGGWGGTVGRDLYLVHNLPERAAARLDPVEPFSYLDRGQAFAVLSANVEPQRVLACTTSAYVQARLYGQNPAEAHSVRASTAAYVAWLVTGDMGCSAGVDRAQREPWRSIMGADGNDEGALWLALLGAERDGNRGHHLWNVWQLARQRTWEGEHLRASPDLWEAIDAVESQRSTQFDDLVERLSVARYGAQHWVPESVPLWQQMHYAELPARTRPASPPLETLGSAYVVVHTPTAKPGDQLRVWLRGEEPVRWSLVAVRLDAEGRERGRVSAPPRRETKSYLVVDLDAETRQVLVAVTNLSHRLPDADEPDDNERSAYLIVDKSAAQPVIAPIGVGSGS